MIAPLAAMLARAIMLTVIVVLAYIMIAGACNEATMRCESSTAASRCH